MAVEEYLIDLWNSADANSVLKSKEVFEKNIDSFLEFMVARTREKERFEIDLFEDGWQKGSVISYSEPHGQKAIELRLKKNENFEILLKLTTENEQQFILRRQLSKEEIQLIPVRLVQLMFSIKELEKPMSFYNSGI